MEPRSYASYHTSMAAVKKITVYVDEILLKKALAASGLGVSDAVREGLLTLSRRQTGAKIRRLRGRLHLELDLDSLRAVGQLAAARGDVLPT